MKQVTIGERTFQIRKVPAYPDQMLLAKSAMSVWQDILPLLVKAARDPDILKVIKDGKAANIPADFLIEIVDTFVGAVRRLSDDDLLSLTRRSLSAAQIKQGDAGWSNLMVGDQLAFDLDLSTIIQLIYQAVEVNLGGFFAASLGTSQGKPVAA